MVGFFAGGMMTGVIRIRRLFVASSGRKVRCALAGTINGPRIGDWRRYRFRDDSGLN